MRDQATAIEHYFHAKIQPNPENIVDIHTTGGKSLEFLLLPTNDRRVTISGRIHAITKAGGMNVVDALELAYSGFEYRDNIKLRRWMILFVGGNLEALVAAVDNKGNNHIVHVPSASTICKAILSRCSSLTWEGIFSTPDVSLIIRKRKYMYEAIDALRITTHPMTLFTTGIVVLQARAGYTRLDDRKYDLEYARELERREEDRRREILHERERERERDREYERNQDRERERDRDRDQKRVRERERERKHRKEHERILDRREKERDDKLHDDAKVAEKHTTLHSALLQLASDSDGGSISEVSGPWTECSIGKALTEIPDSKRH
ncbi:SART-1 family protein DOT2 [Tanacetum coccineum]